MSSVPQLLPMDAVCLVRAFRAIDQVGDFFALRSEGAALVPWKEINLSSF